MNKLGRRIAIGVGLGVAVAIGMALYSDASALLASLSTFDGWVLLPVLGLSLVGYGLRILKWEIYLKRLRIDLPRSESALVFLAGLVMSITPGKVGEVLKSFLLRSSREIPVARTAPIVVAERLTDLVALLVLAAWGVWSSGYGLAVVAITGGLVAALLVVVAWPPAARLCLRLAERTPLVRRIAHKLAEAYESLLALIGLRTLLATTAVSIVAWGGEAVGTWLVLNAFPGVDAGLGESVFVYSFATLAGAVSMLPGGLGLTEGSMIALLHQVFAMVPTKQIATAATLIVRFSTLWFGVAIGAVALAVWQRRHGRPPALSAPDGV